MLARAVEEADRLRVLGLRNVEQLHAGRLLTLLLGLVGRSVWQTTFGLRGSDTSTAVKFFGALSCASQRMRRPSGAICTDMPSPMPPKPSSMWWESSLKFQMTVPSAPGWPDLRLTAGFLTDDDFFADFLMDLAFNAFLAAGL